MKFPLFLLFIVTIISPNLIFAGNNTSTFLSFPLEKTYNSSYYSQKKIEEQHKKVSFKSKIKNSFSKTSLHQIDNNSTNKLQTLAIKLDSIKQLHQKGLLKKEVLINTDYYNRFLLALKNSHKKYQSTFNISLILGFLLIISITFLFLSKRKKTISVSLTKQELIIKNLITNGKTNKEIANELHISLNTVKTHISNLYQKLNVSNRKELLVKSKI